MENVEIKNADIQNVENKSVDTKKVKKRVKRNLLQLLIKIGIFIAFVFVMFTFILGLKRFTGNNMFPMFKDGDLCFYFRLTDFYLDDVVVYKNPNGELQLGRIVGLENQEINFPKEGGYTLNDSIPSEYLPYETYKSEYSEIEYPLNIPEGSYFILNDFRSDTKDSREYGVISKKDIKGKVIYLLRRRSF